MRQRFDDGRVNRQHRVEQVRQTNALCFGNQTEECAVPVEAPRTTLFDERDAGFVVAIEQFVRHFAGGRLVRQLKRFGPEPLDADHSDQCIGEDAANSRVGLKVFEPAHDGPR